MNPHAIQRRPANAFDASAKAASHPDAADAEAGLRQSHAGTAPATPALAAGQVLLEAGAFTEHSWRVDSIVLRLDLLGEGNEHSVQSALQGERVEVDAVHGMPTLAGGRRLSDDGRTAIELPCLAHIAAIVGIAQGTGSRILGHRRRQGLRRTCHCRRPKTAASTTRTRRTR